MSKPKPKGAARRGRPRTSEGGRPRRPFDGKRCLYNAVQVQFASSFIKHTYDARLLELNQKDLVVVETSKGPALARIASYVYRTVAPTGSLKRVLRLANREDERRAAQNQRKEEEAFRFALVRIRERSLPMKLIQVQYMHDGSKAIFYFSADGRIDFRELVKDLASRFRTRIEMRQIGVRDGARMVGGIGSCGRELCCSTFLEQFSPVSIRMAKDQGLTLNPKKVSGMCGRLMCCLVYEQQIYRKARKRLPRIGKPVRTALGLGKIQNVDVLRERVSIFLEEEGQLEHFPVSEIIVLTAQEAERIRDQGTGQAPEAAEEALDPDQRLREVLSGANSDGEEYLWDDEGSGGDEQDNERKRPRRNRSRRRRGGRPSNAQASGGSDAPEGASSSEAQEGGANRSGAKHKDRRRRPRNRSREGSRRSGKRTEGSANKTSRTGGDTKPTSGESGGAGGDQKSGGRRRRRRRRRPPSSKGGGTVKE
ncbi:MAG: stage 0 sporulation family protein [Myxococcota bacterium]